MSVFSDKRVLVIGLDGASPLVLSFMKQRGMLRSGLRHLMESGVYKVLISTIPPLSAPAWATAFSGLTPGEHGIYDFVVRTRAGARFHNSSSLRGKMVWDILSRKGVKSILVNVPLTYPPYKINGIMVSGFPSPENRLCAFPRTVQFILRRRFKRYAIDISFINPNYTGIRLETFFKEIVDLTKSRLELARFLMSNYDWNLFILVFTELDRLQHVLWGYFEDYLLNGVKTDIHLKFARLLLNYYRWLDEIVGELMSLAGSEAYVIVFSDHGFERLEGWFSVYEIARTAILGKKSVETKAFDSILSNFFRTFFESLKKYKLGSLLGGLYYRLPVEFQSKILPGCLAEAHTGGLRLEEIEVNLMRKEEIAIKLSRFVKMFGLPIERILIGKNVYKGRFSDYAPDILIIPNKGWKPVKYLKGKLYEKFHLTYHIMTETGIHQSNFARKGVFLTKGLNMKTISLNSFILPIDKITKIILKILNYE